MEILDLETLNLLADLEAGLAADLDWEADDELGEMAD